MVVRYILPCWCWQCVLIHTSAICAGPVYWHVKQHLYVGACSSYYSTMSCHIILASYYGTVHWHSVLGTYISFQCIHTNVLPTGTSTGGSTLRGACRPLYMAITLHCHVQQLLCLHPFRSLPSPKPEAGVVGMLHSLHVPRAVRDNATHCLTASCWHRHTPASHCLAQHGLYCRWRCCMVSQGRQYILFFSYEQKSPGTSRQN